MLIRVFLGLENSLLKNAFLLTVTPFLVSILYPVLGITLDVYDVTTLPWYSFGCIWFRISEKKLSQTHKFHFVAFSKQWIKEEINKSDQICHHLHIIHFILAFPWCTTTFQIVLKYWNFFKNLSIIDCYCFVLLFISYTIFLVSVFNKQGF